MITKMIEFLIRNAGLRWYKRCSVEGGHLEIVQLLMTSTTNPNVADYHGSGRTPEYVASLRGHNDIVKLFRKRARLQREKEK